MYGDARSSTHDYAIDERNVRCLQRPQLVVEAVLLPEEAAHHIDSASLESTLINGLTNV